jgi:hypothetical protein
MNDQQQAAKAKKTTKSLDDEIAATREKLRKLEEQKKDKERKELEKNRKAITALLSTEKLDTMPVEIWTAALPGLRKLLKVPEAKESKSAGGVRPSATAGSTPRMEPSLPGAPAAKSTELGGASRAGASVSLPEPA